MVAVDTAKLRRPKHYADCGQSGNGERINTSCTDQTRFPLPNHCFKTLQVVIGVHRETGTFKRNITIKNTHESVAESKASWQPHVD